MDLEVLVEDFNMVYFNFSPLLLEGLVKNCYDIYAIYILLLPGSDQGLERGGVPRELGPANDKWLGT